MILYVYERIPCKSITRPIFGLDIEIIGLETHHVTRKCLFKGTYYPRAINGMEFINELVKIMNHFSNDNEHNLFIDYLKMNIKIVYLITFFATAQLECSQRHTYLLTIK